MAPELYGLLHGSRERLCLAQGLLESPAMRAELDAAVAAIDRVGSLECAQWSRFDGTDLEAG